MKKICKIDGCNKEVRYKKINLCNSHYMVEYRIKNNFYKKNIEKICEICQNKFEIKNLNNKYCSKECRKIGRYKNNNKCRKKLIINKECYLCNLFFKTSRSFQKVCSECKDKYILLRKREYYNNVLKQKYGYLNKGSSFPQKFIYNILCKNFINLNWTFNDRTILKNPITNYPLELDIFCKSMMIGIEYDGEHHFSTKIYGEKIFNYVNSLDLLKNKLCKEYGIKLLRISYKDDWKNKNFLINKIGEILK